MSFIIKATDKRSGLTYFYECQNYWDKEKKRSCSKRKLIGKLDPNTGETIPTDGRGQKRNLREERKHKMDIDEVIEILEEMTKRHAKYGDLRIAVDTAIKILKKEKRKKKKMIKEETKEEAQKNER